VSETPSLRERKKQRTRETIERVALDLFEERGFDGATVEDIAVAAEIAPRTFFHYFPSKEDVVLADYAARLDKIVAALREDPRGEGPKGEAPWQALRAAFLGVAVDYEAARHQLLRRFRIVQMEPSVGARSLQLQAGWENAVAAVVADWLGTEASRDVVPGLLAGAALAAMRASLARWLTDDGRTSLPDHLVECFDLMHAGLGGISGSRTTDQA
jgi:TetR/AcrR family transcriptional regulator, regulator of mycofactocin system